MNATVGLENQNNHHRPSVVQSTPIQTNYATKERVIIELSRVRLIFEYLADFKIKWEPEIETPFATLAASNSLMTSSVYSDSLGTSTANLSEQLRPKIEHGSVEHARLTNQLLSNFMMKNAAFGNTGFGSPAGIWAGSSFNSQNNNLKYTGHIGGVDLIGNSEWQPSIRESESPSCSSHHDSVISSSPTSNSPNGQSPITHFPESYQKDNSQVQMLRGPVIRVPVIKGLDHMEHASHTPLTPQHFEPTRPKSPIISPISPYSNESITDQVYITEIVIQYM